MPLLSPSPLPLTDTESPLAAFQSPPSPNKPMINRLQKQRKLKPLEQPPSPIVAQLIEMGFQRKKVEFAIKSIGMYYVVLDLILSHRVREKFYRKTQTTISFQFSSMKCVKLDNCRPKIASWILLYVKSSLVQEMDWCRLGAKPFLGQMMTKSLTPICGYRGQ